MELRHLRYFVAVVDAGTYRAASRILNIAQPAISQTISDLESELGVPLFMRTGRGVSLSSYGKVFYSEATDLLQHARQAIRTIKGMTEDDVPNIRIGFWGPLGNGILQDIICYYRNAHPGIAISCIEFNTLEGEAALAEGQIDLLLTKSMLALKSERWSYTLLSQDPFYLTVPAAWSQADFDGQIGMLREAELFLVDDKGMPEISAYSMELARNMGLHRSKRTSVSSLGNAIAFVRAGLGFAIIPACAMPRDFPEICLVPISGSEEAMPLIALQSQGSTVSFSWEITDTETYPLTTRSTK